MESGDNILDAINEEDNLDDIEMIDIEQGEFVDHSQIDSAQNGAGEADQTTQDVNRGRKPNKKKNKKRKKKKGSCSGSNTIDINRFVIDTCRRLKEKKTYMLYTAIGCLGISALSDLVKEVDAIQACGGQKTADGKRFRTGGGILWGIIKVREPNAFKEIMKKTNEFEKQFRQPSVKQTSIQKEEDSFEGVPFTFSGGNQGNVSENPFGASQTQDQPAPSSSEVKRVSVHDRLRLPVSYDDDLLGVGAVNDAT